MQIHSGLNNNISFNSKFTPNDTLNRCFNRAIVNGDRKFLKSVKAVLNDGFERTVTAENLKNGRKYDMTILSLSDRSGGYWIKTQKASNERPIDRNVRDAQNVINNFAKSELALDKKVNIYPIEKTRTQLKQIKREIFG